MTREHVLKSLLEYTSPLDGLIADLRAFEWDSDVELVFLSPAHIIAVLRRYLANQIRSEDVEAWANAVECREDIGYAVGYGDMLHEAIFVLANPLLTSPLNPHIAQRMTQALSEPVSEKTVLE